MQPAYGFGAQSLSQGYSGIPNRGVGTRHLNSSYGGAAPGLFGSPSGGPPRLQSMPGRQNGGEMYENSSGASYGNYEKAQQRANPAQGSYQIDDGAYRAGQQFGSRVGGPPGSSNMPAFGNGGRQPILPVGSPQAGGGGQQRGIGRAGAGGSMSMGYNGVSAGDSLSMGMAGLNGPGSLYGRTSSSSFDGTDAGAGQGAGQTGGFRSPMGGGVGSTRAQSQMRSGGRLQPFPGTPFGEGGGQGLPHGAVSTSYQDTEPGSGQGMGRGSGYGQGFGGPYPSSALRWRSESVPSQSQQGRGMGVGLPSALSQAGSGLIASLHGQGQDDRLLPPNLRRAAAYSPGPTASLASRSPGTGLSRDRPGSKVGYGYGSESTHSAAPQRSGYGHSAFPKGMGSGGTGGEAHHESGGEGGGGVGGFITSSTSTFISPLSGATGHPGSSSLSLALRSAQQLNGGGGGALGPVTYSGGGGGYGMGASLDGGPSTGSVGMGVSTLSAPSMPSTRGGTGQGTAGSLYGGPSLSSVPVRASAVLHDNSPYREAMGRGAGAERHTGTGRPAAQTSHGAAAVEAVSTAPPAQTPMGAKPGTKGTTAGQGVPSTPAPTGVTAPPGAGVAPLRSAPNGTEDVIALPHRIVTSVSQVAAVGAVSWRGRNPSVMKVNQDAVVVAEHGPTSSLLVAVFDGHGVNGREVSSFFKERYPQALFTDRRFQSKAGQGVSSPSRGGKVLSPAGRERGSDRVSDAGSTGTGTDEERESAYESGSQRSDSPGAGAGRHGKGGGHGHGARKGGAAASALCDIMADVLLATELALIQASGINVTLSGSTGVVVLIRDGVLHVINVGDSRGILVCGSSATAPIAPAAIAAASIAATNTGNAAAGFVPGSGVGPGGRPAGPLDMTGSDPRSGGPEGLCHPSVRPRVLTVDHKPDAPKERQRILSTGGRVMATRIKGAPHLLGPPRVWLKNAPLPGLNMSRSLGDLIAKQAGVISTPHKAVHALQGSSDRALVLASDGLWDFVTNEETGALALSSGDTWEASARLARLARSRWLIRTGGADDTTVVIVRFGVGS